LDGVAIVNPPFLHELAPRAYLSRMIGSLMHSATCVVLYGDWPTENRALVLAALAQETGIPCYTLSDFVEAVQNGVEPQPVDEVAIYPESQELTVSPVEDPGATRICTDNNTHRPHAVVHCPGKGNWSAPDNSMRTFWDQRSNANPAGVESHIHVEQDGTIKDAAALRGLVKDSPRASVLNEARDLITGDRNHSYGPPTQDFQRTADVLTALGYRRETATEEILNIVSSDVAILVASVKLSRLMHSRSKRDNWTDLAGYAGCGYECSITEEGN
jgi:hypothetical protein